jgi:hypothetical protein
MLVKRAFVFLVFALSLTEAQPNFGQNGSSKAGCDVLDRTRAPQLITFESKLESNVRLRLRNNTSCAIVVETDDQYPTQLKRLPSGGVRIEAVLEPREGLRLLLHYLIDARRRGEAPRPAYGWGDSVFVYEIPPGQSVIFDVPATHFKRRSNIAVPFGYAWEDKNSIGTNVGGVVHSVYFLFEDLPPAVLR